MKSGGYSHTRKKPYVRELGKYFCRNYVLQWYRKTFAKYSPEAIFTPHRPNGYVRDGSEPH